MLSNNANGLIGSYRLEYGTDAQPYDGETEIRFENLYQKPERDWQETCRAEIPSTVEYQHKQEAARLAKTARAVWMDAAQQRNGYEEGPVDEMNIIGHVSKKMTSVILAVMRDNKLHEPALLVA